MLKPVLESEAVGQVKSDYGELKQALEVSSLPLFFTYLGAFPEYLDYITDQLISNLKDSQFNSLHQLIGEQITDLIQSSLVQSEEAREWLNRYSHSPEYYYFQQNTNAIYSTNIKLAFIFIALREAVKGWAIAAKKLSSSNSFSSQDNSPVSERDFVFDDILTQLPPSYPNLPNTSNLSSPSQSLAQTAARSIEVNLLQEYLVICRNDFQDHMKQNEFWILRLGIEKMILSSLDSMPTLIFSPINVVLNLSSKYPNFPDLLYLLSEHFPTYAVQRLIFSGYLNQ